MHNNTAGSRYVLTNEETEAFLGLIRELIFLKQLSLTIDMLNCTLPEQLLVCNLSFFYILKQPFYGVSHLPPPTDQTGIVCFLHPLDGSSTNLHFFIFFLVNFQKIHL